VDVAFVAGVSAPGTEVFANGNAWLATSDEVKLDFVMLLGGKCSFLVNDM